MPKTKAAQEIVHINSQTPGPVALFAETILAFEIVEALGKGALDIAVFSEGTRQEKEQRILEIGKVMALNNAKPGEFAQYMFGVRVPDKRGHARPVVGKGQVHRVMLHWAGQSANLMRGMRRRDLAKFLKMAPTDKRIDQITKGIQVALEKALGVRAGWYQGRFRILTAKQVEQKTKARIANNVQGNVKAAEKDQKYVEVRGAEEVGQASFNIKLFSELPEVADAVQ